MSKREVLLLNASEEAINVIPWQKAATLFLGGKAEKPWNYEDCYGIKTSSGLFELPKALVLVQYVSIPYKKASVTRRNIFKRDKNTCQYCGDSVNYNTGSIDHVLPRSRGGRYSWKNLTTACKSCNHSKGNRTPKQARMKLRTKPFVPSREFLLLSVIARDGTESWSRWVPFEDDLFK